MVSKYCFIPQGRKWPCHVVEAGHLHKLATIILVVLLLGLFNIQVYGAQSSSEPGEKMPILSEEQSKKLDKESAQSDDIPLLDEESEAALDEFQEWSSGAVLEAAEWIDSFFDDRRYRAETNRTRAKLKLQFGYSELNDFEFLPSIDLRLKLPALEDRVSLFLLANDDSDFDSDSNPLSSIIDRTDNQQVSAGIRYFLSLAEEYNVSTELGLSSGYGFGGLRFRNAHKLFSEDWVGRFTNRLRYYTDEGWENAASYDVERYIGESFFLRSSLIGVVAEQYDGVPFATVFRLYQVLDIDRAILYDASAYFATSPDFEVTDVQLSLRYRQRFFRDWLVLEVAPLVTFPKDEDRDFNPGLVVKFEAEFGYLKDRKAYHSIFDF